MFPFIYFCSILIVIKAQLSHDCTNYTGSRPFISFLEGATEDYNAPGDPRQSSVDRVGLLENANVGRFQQFNCTHDKPIRWVFHLHPHPWTTMNIYIDFSENTGTEYSANFKFHYFNREFGKTPNSKLFSCEPYSLEDEDGICQRSFVQVLRSSFQPVPVTENGLDQSLKNLSLRLLHSSLEESRRNFSNLEIGNCSVTLFVKIEEGNIIKYRWESKIGNLVEFEDLQTNETTFFENALRLIPKYDEGCAFKLNEGDSCADCVAVGDKKLAEWNVTKEHTLNGVIFYAKYGDGERVHKGHFSVPKWNEGREKRNFYFDWEITPSIIYDEMIQIDSPNLVYSNVSFELKCRVSIFHFSFGTVLATSEVDEVELTSLYGKRLFREQWMPFGYREIKHDLKFESVNDFEAKVGCHAPLRRSPGWIRKFKNVIVEEAIPPTINGSSINSSEIIIVREDMVEIALDCNVTGNPVPEFEWIFPKNLTKFPEVRRNQTFNRLIFPAWHDSFQATFKCKATNRFGVTTRSITFIKHEESSKLVVIISTTLGVILLFLAFSIGLLAWKIRKQRMEFEEQTQKAIEEFRHGIMGEYSDDMEHANFSVLQLPYNEGFEMKKELWTIEDKILGSGQFGIVRMGKVKIAEREVKVAVKTLKSAVEIDEFKSFLFELKIMAFLGHHKNIVSLVAACTEGINDRDIFIGVEFCDNGCLLSYLRKHRASFRNMVTEDGNLISDANQIQFASTEIDIGGGAYANISSYTISTYDLYRWSYHIASGMEYLAVKKVLHGDLAARNVLLTQRKVAKVGDFGLSRVLMNSENYTKRTQTALPWKWMALESLKERVFSTSSDVWAYGVTIWELFTLGQSPYPGIGWSPDFVVQLEKGLRMERPVHCTKSIYKIMQGCWDNDPSRRPKYAKIKIKLAKALQRLSVYANVSPPAKLPQQNSERATPTTMPNIVMEDAGIYNNVQQRSTNYYKNC